MTGGPGILFRERLVPRWPAWLVTGALVVMVSVAFGAALGAVVGWALGLGLAVCAVAGTLLLSPVILVTADELRVGPATLPRSRIVEAVALDAEAARAARGPGADARIFVLLRTLHASTAVLVRLQDPEDPHPAWLVTSARPGALVDALLSS